MNLLYATSSAVCCSILLFLNSLVSASKLNASKFLCPADSVFALFS